MLCDRKACYESALRKRFEMKTRICLLLCLFVGAYGEPMTEADMMQYLEKFGYTDGKTVAAMADEDMTKALEEFQEFNALPVTGKMDEETRKMMERPRCGRPDKGFLPMEFNVNRAFVWNKRSLTYKFNNFPMNGYSRQLAEQETRRAFGVWSQIANINFEQKQQGNVDIDITFNPNHRGDGPGRTLAYAYFPQRGDIYFDTENWTPRGQQGINYFQVATHEIGHSIGLSHQEGVPQAVMAPFYHGYLPNFRLHAIDIQRAQALYGPRQRASGPPASGPPASGGGSGQGPAFCTGKVDATFATSRDRVYVLSGNQVWRYDGERLASGYPKSFDAEWPGLPSDIDAAYRLGDRYYFFKGKKAYVFDGNMRDHKFGENVGAKIDAAVTINQRLYMFINGRYWLFNTQPRLVRQRGYPKTIAQFWRGVPNSVDASYFDHKKTVYFIKGQKIYKFDTVRKVAVSESISQWFPCRT